MGIKDKLSVGNTSFLFISALVVFLPTLVHHKVAAFNVLPLSKSVMYVSNKRYIHFGYSVILQENASGKNLIVGAPKDFSSKLRQNIRRPRDGAIYMCNLDLPRSKKVKKKDLCSPLTINPALRPQKTIYSCNFENNTDLEYLTMGDLNWTKINHRTESDDTGPDFDHTLKTKGIGSFLYLEASRRPNQSHANGLAAMASTPRFQSTSGACVRFWYHMYGQTIGSLNVYLYTNKTGLRMIWNRDGNHNNIWHSGYVTLISEDDYKVVFEAIRGIDWDGDIAIDDIVITEGQCTEDLNGIGQSVGGSVSMNPKTGEVLACAPNWKFNCSGNMQVTGLCYLMSNNLTLTDQSILSPSLKQVCGTGQLDLIFLVDESSTVQNHSFINIRYWLRNIISSLPIGEQYIQVGVAVYNEDPKVIFHLNEFYRIQDFREALNRVEYRGGGTGTGNAIDFLTDTMFSPEHGMRENAKHVAVVITDGKSQDDVTEAAKKAKDKGISMIAIGVGSEIDVSELLQIASSAGNVYRQSNYDALEAIRGQIKQSITALESQGKTYTTEQSQAGISSTFINNNLILGLPGLIDWSGGYATYSISNNGSLQVPKRTSFQSLLTSYYSQKQLTNTTREFTSNISVSNGTNEDKIHKDKYETTDSEPLTKSAMQTTVAAHLQTTSRPQTITHPFTIPKPTESRQRRSSTEFEDELASHDVHLIATENVENQVNNLDIATTPVMSVVGDIKTPSATFSYPTDEDPMHTDTKKAVFKANEVTKTTPMEKTELETVALTTNQNIDPTQFTNVGSTTAAGYTNSSYHDINRDSKTVVNISSQNETTEVTDKAFTISNTSKTNSTKINTTMISMKKTTQIHQQETTAISTDESSSNYASLTTQKYTTEPTEKTTIFTSQEFIKTTTTFPANNFQTNKKISASEKTIFKRDIQPEVERFRRSLSNTEASVDDLVTSTMSNAYFGYTVASGNVVKPDRVDLVVAAPRSMSKGKIYVIHKTSFAGSIERDSIIQEHHGKQMGSYFGYALCVTDTNNDGIDDIFVGAPLWFDKYENEGRVFGFISSFVNGNEASNPNEVVLYGLREKGSRFGFAIAAAGDLNKDQYNDIVIGAPSTANGDGAVYVYNGRPNGITPYYTQVIRASQKRKNRPEFFGFSIHVGLDVDDNGYNDIAVGCPGNDRVAILFTRPVAHVSTYLMASPNKFNLSSHYPNNYGCEGNGTEICSNVTVCFFVNATNIQSMAYFYYTLQADAGSPLFRARGRFSNTQGKIRINTSQKVCVSSMLYIQLPVRNQLVPLTIALSYNMPEKTGKKLSANSPILDIFDTKTKYINITFNNDCTNGTCKSDLQTQCITSRKDMPAKQNMVIVDINKMIAVNVNVTNLMKTAYDVHMDVKFNSSLYLIRIAPVNGQRCMMDMGSGLLSEKKLDQPAGIQGINKFSLQYQHATMRIGEICLFTLQFGVKESFKGGKVSIQISTMSSNVETNPENNDCDLDMNVMFESDFTLYGKSEKRQTGFSSGNESNIVSFNDIGPEVWHHYDIYNQGPSIIPNTTLVVKWPTDLKSGHDILYLYALSCDPPDLCTCEDTDILVNPDNINKTGQLEMSTNRGNDKIDLGNSQGISKVDKRTKTKFHETSFNCDLGEVNCETIICSFKELKPSKSASLKLGFRIWKHTFTEANLWKVTLASKATASVRNSRFLVTSSGHSLKNITTVAITQAFNTEFEEFSEPTSYKPNWWIYAAAAAAGVCLLFVAILILRKIGFFKSKYKQQMEEELEWKNSFEYTAGHKVSYEGSRDQPYNGQNLSTFQRGLPQSPTL